jgi:hypothetical protein
MDRPREWIAPPLPAPPGIEHPSAADRGRGGEPTDEDAVAAHRDDRRGQSDLDPSGFARRDSRIDERSRRSDDLRGMEMNADGERLERARERDGRIGEHPPAHQQATGRAQRARFRELHPPRQLRQVRPGELERGALAGSGSSRMSVYLHRASAHAQTSRQQLQLVAGSDRAGKQRAGDDDTLAFDQKSPVDGQTCGIGEADRRRQFRSLPAESVDERRHPFAGERGEGKDRGTGETRLREELVELERDELGGLRVDGVDLVEGDDQHRQLEQLRDRQVLAGLCLDPLVGGDDQEQDAHAAQTCQGVVEKALMSGDVDEGELHRFIAAGEARRGKVGEAEIEGDAAALLLRQAIAVDAGHGAHQCRLAVVDVPRRTDQHRAHRLSLRQAARARCG